MPDTIHVEPLLHLSALTLAVSVAYLGLDRVHLEKDAFFEALKKAQIKAEKFVKRYEVGEAQPAEDPFYYLSFWIKLKFFVLCHVAERPVDMGWLRILHVCHRQRYVPLLRYFKARNNGENQSPEMNPGLRVYSAILAIECEDDEIPKIAVSGIAIQAADDVQAADISPSRKRVRNERRDRKFVSICAAVSAAIFLALTAAATWDVQYLPADYDYLRWFKIDHMREVSFWTCFMILSWVFLTVGITHILQNVESICDGLEQTIEDWMKKLSRDVATHQLNSNSPTKRK